MPTYDEIKAAYDSTHSVWKAGKLLRMKGQTVHGILRRLGVEMCGAGKKWTSQDDEKLRAEYTSAVDSGKLPELAESMGRTKHYLCMRARRLGLTDNHRKKPYTGEWASMTDEQAREMWDRFKNSKAQLYQFLYREGLEKKHSSFTQKMKAMFADEWDDVMESKKRKSSSYNLGRNVEYSAKKALEKAGFLVVRSAGSKSPIDLLAVRAGVSVAVQAKRSMKMRVDEWNIFYDLVTSSGCLPVVVGRPDGLRLRWGLMTGKKVPFGRGRDVPMQDWSPTPLN